MCLLKEAKKAAVLRCGSTLVATVPETRGGGRWLRRLPRPLNAPLRDTLRRTGRRGAGEGEGGGGGEEEAGWGAGGAAGRRRASRGDFAQTVRQLALRRSPPASVPHAASWPTPARRRCCSHAPSSPTPTPRHAQLPIHAWQCPFTCDTRHTAHLSSPSCSLPCLSGSGDITSLPSFPSSFLPSHGSIPLSLPSFLPASPTPS